MMTGEFVQRTKGKKAATRHDLRRMFVGELKQTRVSRLGAVGANSFVYVLASLLSVSASLLPFR